MREHELNEDSEQESLIQCISFERDLCAEFNDFPYMRANVLIITNAQLPVNRNNTHL